MTFLDGMKKEHWIKMCQSDRSLINVINIRLFWPIEKQLKFNLIEIISLAPPTKLSSII